MSTKSTIDYGVYWSLHEEMFEEKVFLEVENANFVATQRSVEIELRPSVIDAIRAAPASAFPHLRGREAK